MNCLLPLLRRVSLIPLLLIGASCATRPEGSPRAETPPPAFIDYSSRRLGGRETLRLAEGVTLHADRMTARPDGITVAKGSVYVNGSRAKNPEPFGWPDHGYAEFAEWDPATKTLTLKGWPIVESNRGHQQIAMDATTQFVLENASFKALGGRTRTQIVTR